MDSNLTCAPLLSPKDPAAVEWHNAAAGGAILLLCEHAGNHVPESLGRLGLEKDILSRHVAWDIGAEGLARRLSDRLSAPLILQRYSRLVVDCNRPPGSEGSICETSDGIMIPGNANLSGAEHDRRCEAIFDPLDMAISNALVSGKYRAAFSVHSYTREFGGQARPWHAGFLTRKDTNMADSLIRHISAAAPELNLAPNEPYQIDDESDWFIPTYAEPRNLRHSLIEVRNDQLRNAAGQDHWANLIADAIKYTLGGTP